MSVIPLEDLLQDPFFAERIEHIPKGNRDHLKNCLTARIIRSTPTRIADKEGIRYLHMAKIKIMRESIEYGGVKNPREGDTWILPQSQGSTDTFQYKGKHARAIGTTWEIMVSYEDWVETAGKRRRS